MMGAKVSQLQFSSCIYLGLALISNSHNAAYNTQWKLTVLLNAVVW